MSERYYVYTVINETLSELCKLTSCSTQEIIRINTQMYNQEKTVSQIITEYQLRGEKLPIGMGVRIPYQITGGKEISYTKYELKPISEILAETTYNKNQLLDSPVEDDITYDYMKGVVTEAESFQYTLNTPTEPLPHPSTKDSWKDFNCFITVYSDRVSLGAMLLPVYPQEFQDNNKASFGATSIFGRSVSYQTYQSSERIVSLSLQLHEELCTDKTYIQRLVKYIQSSCYPDYSSNQVKVPEIAITIGKQFRCRGIINDCSATWKAPIIEGNYVNCDLSISIIETVGPFSMSNINNIGGYREG